MRGVCDQTPAPPIAFSSLSSHASLAPKNWRARGGVSCARNRPVRSDPVEGCYLAGSRLRSLVCASSTPSHRSGSAAGALSTRRAPVGDAPSHRSGNAAGALSTRRAPAGDEEAENKLPTPDMHPYNTSSSTRKKKTRPGDAPFRFLRRNRGGWSVTTEKTPSEKSTSGYANRGAGGRRLHTARPGPGVRGLRRFRDFRTRLLVCAAGGAVRRGQCRRRTGPRAATLRHRAHARPALPRVPHAA